MILVERFFAYNDLRNYSYLIFDPQKADSWVIDPFEAAPIANFIKKNGLKLKGILNTHQHFDHIRGNAPLQKMFHTEVCHLKNQEHLTLSESFTLEVLNTPGHTLDHQVFIWKEEGIPLGLFSGDTLFNSGVGNCRHGGDVNQLFETTKKLQDSLPDSTFLYPGHDYRKNNLEFAKTIEPDNSWINENLRALEQESTENLPPVTLGDEKKVNPFLRLQSEELRQNIISKNKQLFDKPDCEREFFIKLREFRDQW